MCGAAGRLGVTADFFLHALEKRASKNKTNTEGETFVLFLLRLVEKPEAKINK